MSLDQSLSLTHRLLYIFIRLTGQNNHNDNTHIAIQSYINKENKEEDTDTKEHTHAHG